MHSHSAFKNGTDIVNEGHGLTGTIGSEKKNSSKCPSEQGIHSCIDKRLMVCDKLRQKHKFNISWYFRGNMQALQYGNEPRW